ncbi:hypothetical protein FB45DRAFT_1021425 [Roridomyces roridus]|uniref:Uncharacterized protein n=1 Tax=Roridomyces roridus TaxID=1738132 RepID=A0AAD7CCM6_9AGAR|nr:hypothetical protein FB45DRAFT_1021425 [Roridomyces roridus]
MTQNLIILSKFPSVSQLELVGWGRVEYESREEAFVYASDVLPLLREYHGTCTPLGIFLSKPTLTRLFIHHSDPRALTVHLHKEYRHITLLLVMLTSLDQETLSTICTRLPSLIDLGIHTSQHFEEVHCEDGINTQATDLFSTLTDTPLPRTLERLVILWQFDFEFEHDEEEGVPVASPENIPDFVAMRDKLRERCPALRTLWLDGQDFMFKWRQLLDREEMEQENTI